MQLMTQKLEQRFNEVGDQSQETDPIIVARYGDALNSTIWLMSEYDLNDKIFKGYYIDSLLDLYNFAKSSITLDRMIQINSAMPMSSIIRDTAFEECRLSEALNKLHVKTHQTLAELGYVPDETQPDREQRFTRRLQELQQMDISREQDNQRER